MGIKKPVIKPNNALTEAVSSITSINESSKAHVPQALVTLPVVDVEKLSNESNKIKILVNLPLDIDEKLLSDQMIYRRRNKKRLSKEDIIISILKSHYKI